jgi:hypothetical protein
MNAALRASIKAIQTHGVTVNYTSKTNGIYDPSVGDISISETNYSLQSYPKHQITNQYNFPDMIGKTVVTFYLPGSLAFTPKVGDSITYSGSSFRVFSLDSHIYMSDICLYRLNSVSV